ncbi:carbohydrate kinase family protein [Candidatus Woesearchaeota archaeon]|nr:carbohydrate kinase family protein [Candidatus Woesearchaeota archaeon]
MYDVIACGSATRDVFAHTKAELISIRSIDSEQSLVAYPSGSKILIKSLEFQIGGGGTNTAVSFARLGLKTAFMGKLGNDHIKESVLALLKKEGIDFIGKISNDEQSGYSIVLDSIAQDRTILTYKGANDTLAWKDINKELLKAKWIYSSSLVGQSFETLKQIAEHAKRHGIRLAFNPSNYQAELGLATIRPVISRCDLLVLNEEEATLLVGKDTVENQLRRLSAEGPSTVVITWGAKGAFILHRKRHYRIMPHKIRILETTGAGDAFASAFLAGLILKDNIKFAAQLGLIQAESVITHLGAKEKILTLTEAQARIRRTPCQVKEYKP